MSSDPTEGSRGAATAGSLREGPTPRRGGPRLTIAAAALVLAAANASAQADKQAPVEPRPIRSAGSLPLNISEKLGQKTDAGEGEGSKPVGGKPARPGQFKWQVALKNPSTGGFFCGGSLIAWRWVLTAAHCTYKDNPLGNKYPPVAISEKEITAFLGSHNTDFGERVAVAKIVRHQDYGKNESEDSDLALLRLEREPGNKAGLELLPLLRKGDDVDTGEKVTVVGWGSTVAGIVPGKLRSPIKDLTFIDDMLIRPSDACNDNHLESERAVQRKAWKAEGFSDAAISQALAKYFPGSKRLITDNMFCAGTNDGSQDACFGDSGGPLVILRRRQAVQAGIVSWGPGDGCALTNLYGVYTRLSRFTDWIEEQMRQ